MRVLGVALALVTLGCTSSCGTSSAPSGTTLDVVELTQAGACGNLSAYGVAQDGEIAVNLYSQSSDPPPWSRTFDLPSEAIEVELLVGRNLDEALCTDLASDVVEIDERITAGSGVVTMSAEAGVATVHFEGIEEFREHGLSEGDVTATIYPSPG